MAMLTNGSPVHAQAPTHISPIVAQSRAGNDNSAYPFGGNTARWLAYQQVHSADSFTNSAPATFGALSFRRGSLNQNDGAINDFEMKMALSPHPAGGASGTFAENVTPGTEVIVFVRKNIIPPTPNDGGWSITFPFDAPFPFPGNAHLSWRAVMHWSNRPNYYYLDAFRDAGGATSPNGPYAGCQALIGTAPARHNVAGDGLALGRRVRMTGASNVHVGSAAALLLLGESATQWQGLALPFDLAPFGAPGCLIVNNVAISLSSYTNLGQVTFDVPIPGAPELEGATVYSQILFAQFGASPSGLFTTNGMASRIASSLGVTRIRADGLPYATFGIVEAQHGIAIGLR